jgi:hypothetical protein
VIAEPGEVGVKGIYTPRTISKVSVSSEIIDSKRNRNSRVVLRKTPDGSCLGDRCGERDSGEVILLYSECVAGGSKLRNNSAVSRKCEGKTRECVLCYSSREYQ